MANTETETRPSSIAHTEHAQEKESAERPPPLLLRFFITLCLGVEKQVMQQVMQRATPYGILNRIFI